MNDERPIEKLLRRYAKKRHDEAGDPLALHPATRRLLQGEVARQYPKSATAEGKSSAMGFFPLLARNWTYAVGTLLVLCVSAAVLLPSLNKSKSESLLAQKETERLAVRESLVLEATPTVAPTETQPKLAVETRLNQPAPEPGGGGNYIRPRDESSTLSFALTNGVAAGSYSRFTDAKRDTDAAARKAEESKQVSLGVSLDAASPRTRALSVQPSTRAAGETISADSLSLAAPARAGRDDASVATDSFTEARQPGAPPPVASAAPATVTTGSTDKSFVARGGGVEKDTERYYSQSFANVATEQPLAKAEKAKAMTPVVPVLANFQVQNVGNEVRVIDSDGSTYRGVVSAAAARQIGIAGAKEAIANYGNVNPGRTQALADSAPAKQQVAQSYLWRVEGTNRTLNQNVVFTFNFVETTNLAASQLKAVSGALNQDAAKSPSQFPALLNNSVINGRAQLGPAQQIEVNAVPVK